MDCLSSSLWTGSFLFSHSKNLVPQDIQQFRQEKVSVGQVVKLPGSSCYERQAFLSTLQSLSPTNLPFSEGASFRLPLTPLYSVDKFYMTITHVLHELFVYLEVRESLFSGLI